ncbi:hypothetical protein FB548_3019 [Pseudoxanthomonas sp. 3HH-4]|uniref:hypothetical protein n=1 Tax=Pseudoxanthomonas sp. 3HH-4 TaxID=1690214 RepID=UPI00115120F2|nr:hypothetical protein [Pseudoxanthomonas sp. 3HH-4]TQM06646.1 hypothetical protein FB548_3019 [Pseudoxanthomonas sp. 3HH-4]
MTGTTWLIVISERVAVVLLVRISRTRLPGFEKTALTVLAVVPLVGPFFAWWLCHQPAPALPSLQDRQSMSLNVHDR